VLAKIVMVPLTGVQPVWPLPAGLHAGMPGDVVLLHVPTHTS
jgi:hypothetical protein